MRTIKLIFACAFFALAFSSNAQTTIKMGQEITSADTVTVEYEFNQVPYSSSSTPQNTLVYIQVDADNSGTIQFSVGEPLYSSVHKAWPAGSKIPITIRNGLRNLRAKASAAGQKFVVTY